MTDTEIIALITNEFASPTLGITEQYLEIHQPVYEDGQIKIARIDRDKPIEEQIAIAYLPVQSEYFSFAVYIDEEKNEVFNIGTESRNSVYLRITSETLSAAELGAYLSFTPTSSWNKGGLTPDGRRIYNFNCIEYEPNPEPDEFEDKLKKLLITLQADKEALIALAAHATLFIQVLMDFHQGNQMLGSALVNLECMKLMTELNLEISFDFTAWGTPFK